MKNPLRVLPALILALALALATGCGLINKPDVPEDAVIETEPVSPVPPVSSAPPAPAEHVLKGWPAKYLPTGFPVYPNGVEDVVKTGWEHHSTDEDSDLITIILKKDNWSLYLLYNKDDNLDDGDNTWVDILAGTGDIDDDDFADNVFWNFVLSYFWGEPKPPDEYR